MSNPGQQPPQLRTYEIRLDSSNPDHAVAMRGLEVFLGAYGIPFQEVIAADSHKTEEVIPKERFTDISRELYGDDIAGRNAIGYIGVFENLYKGISPVDDDHAHIDTRDVNVPHADILRETQEALHAYRVLVDPQQHVYDVLTASCPPFTMRTQSTPQSGNRKSHVFYTPQDITKDTLRLFAEKRSLDAHSLHGSLGKTLDVLLKAGGLSPSEMVSPVPEMEFITPEALQQATKDYSKAVRGKLRYNISRTLQQQLVTGNPTKHGEVIIEGQFAIHKPSAGTFEWHMEYDYIARQSLATIARSYSRQDGIASVLKEIAS